MNTSVLTYRALQEGDRSWLANLLQENWGGGTMVTHAQVHSADRLPGFVALAADQPVGVVLYHLDGTQCEIVLLHSLRERTGIGTTLLEKVRHVAHSAGCRRIWLITTNDNTAAMRYYQKRGFHLVAVYQDALKASRVLKPTIPLIRIDGIPLRDEIELEIDL